eukprot:gene11116-12384_t
MGSSLSSEHNIDRRSSSKTIFDFQVENSNGEVVPLDQFKGKKAYLVVNIANRCALTKQNYLEMQSLYDQYKERGLEILAFPCDNFGNKEESTNEGIVQLAASKGAHFPILGKVDCEKGEEQSHPLFSFLKSSLPAGVFGARLKWNFTKFLCDAHGIPVKRFSPTQSPMAMEQDIQDLLKTENDK